MNQRIAIIDLGTNTFHLLIAEIREDKTFEVLYKAEEFVQLGENGLDKIGNAPFQRGLEQIKKYNEIIRNHNVTHIIGFGTAAIRRASNGDEFIRAIREICPMDVRKISGDEEAEFIYLGVRQAVELSDQPVLIMDIGGGSTEFIIADQHRIHWKQSFGAGASLLTQNYHHSEPISQPEMKSLLDYLNKELGPLLNQRSNYNIGHLIGASGSFDTFASMIAHKFYSPDMLQGKTHFPILAEHFYWLNERLISSTLEERLDLDGMVSFRAKMIVVASLLTSFVIQPFTIQHITQSAYALKEGVLWKLIQNEKV